MHFTSHGTLFQNSRNPQKTMHAKKLTHAVIMHAPILTQQSFFMHLSHAALHKEILVRRDLLTLCLKTFTIINKTSTHAKGNFLQTLGMRKQERFRTE
jgi:hypothetical protein